MRNISALIRQVERIAAEAEARQFDEEHRGRVVIYDPLTRQPLPGYEPSPHAEFLVLLPSNGRDEVK